MVVLLAQIDQTGIFDLGNTSLIFWEVITFLILLFLLIRYVYPPIRNQIRERQAEIERSIDEAEKTRAEARELLAEYRRQIEEARGEGRQILEDARKQAEAQRERTKREVREEGDRIIHRAREEIDRERDAALRDVRSAVVRPGRLPEPERFTHVYQTLLGDEALSGVGTPKEGLEQGALKITEVAQVLFAYIALLIALSFPIGIIVLWLQLKRVYEYSFGT